MPAVSVIRHHLGIDGGWEPGGQVIAVAGNDLDGAGTAMDLHAPAVELDLMNPIWPHRRLSSEHRHAGFDEGG